jgi:hypothetical protein
VGEVGACFFGGCLPALGFAAAAHSACDFAAYLYVYGRGCLLQCLRVGVDGDKLDAAHLLGYHPVYGVAAAAAYTHHFDIDYLLAQGV